MRFFWRIFLLLLVALPVLAVLALFMCFQDSPLVARTVQLTAQDIERAKRIVDEHRPRKGRPDGLQTIAIDQRDLDLALNYLASRFGHAATRVQLQPGTAFLLASIEVPQSPIGRYLNIDASLQETGAAPRFSHLKIGSLPVPAVLANYLLAEAVRRVAATDQGELAGDFIKTMSVGNGRFTATYQWNDQLVTRARAMLVSPEDQTRLRAYHDRLVDEVARAPRKTSLAALMPPLFRLALERGATGDPGRENRAAIIVLAFYANEKGLGVIVPAAAQWPQPIHRTVTLADRDDFPKHFLISAAIAAEGGSPLADAIGVYKEVDDSRGGTGFSFNDIGADRAGTRFGVVASESPERARQLARALSSSVRESDFMPDVSDLPEFMPEPEFKRRYGGIGAPAYNKMMATIETKVAAVPLLK